MRRGLTLLAGAGALVAWAGCTHRHGFQSQSLGDHGAADSGGRRSDGSAPGDTGAGESSPAADTNPPAGDGAAGDDATPPDTNTGDSLLPTNCAGLPDLTACSVDTTVAEGSDRQYDMCVSMTCESPGCGTIACNPPRISFALGDSNQRTCYDAAGVIGCPGVPGDVTCGTTAFCGQDAQYGWDTTNPPGNRATRSMAMVGEPVVLDHVTGRMWQSCPMGLSGATCASGTPSFPLWDAAVPACDTLSWGGFNDWHLPDEWELQSIVDYGTAGTTIDAARFPATAADWYWALGSYTGNPTGARYLTFADGHVSAQNKTNPHAIRCVRTDQPTNTLVPSHFTRHAPGPNTEPVVESNVSGTMWQGCVGGRSGGICATGGPALTSWQAALSYCESLTWAGFDDWRLPNILELYTIVDSHRWGPTLGAGLFPATPFEEAWSSTTNANAPDEAHVAFYNEGHTRVRSKLSSLHTRCVRLGL